VNWFSFAPWAVIAALGLGLWVQSSRLSARDETIAARDATIGAHKAALETTVAANLKAVQAIDDLKAEWKRWNDRAALDAATAARREASTANLRKAITDAPQSDDGPVAPVLRRALDGLPE
jgi:hypothetical protein